MRIIGGTLKGRRLRPPAKKWPTRPTTDRARESLFNILANHWDFAQMRVLDLFGGMGTHSLELISRGCPQVTYVDHYGPCVQFVSQTAAAWGVGDRIRVVRADAFAFIKACRIQFDYIFADPPYDLPTVELLPRLVFEHQLLLPGGWFVLEHTDNHQFDTHPHFEQVRRYGKTLFSFFVQKIP